MSRVSNAPQIRFNDFTDAWKQRKLGDIADIVGGGTPSTAVSEYWDGDIDWYAPAEIVDQIFVNSSQKKITTEGLNNSSAKMLPVGTVLFTSRAGIGKTAILTKEGCTNQGFQSIIPHKDELDSYFIFSRTDELKRYGETVGAGSTFVEVSGKQMANMTISIPTTIGEQRQIGTYFHNLDNLITLHQRKYDQVVNFKKAMLEKMFPKDGCEIPEIRFKDFSGEKANAWQEKSLLEESDVIGTGKSKFNLNESGPYEILGSTSVIGYDDNYDYEGDFILIARVGANAGELYRFSGKVKISDNTVFIQGNKINFIYYLLVKSNLKRLSFGTGQPLVKASELKDKVILVPQNVEEREQIGVFFEKLDKVISLYHHKLQKLNNLKKALLEKMFV